MKQSTKVWLIAGGATVAVGTLAFFLIRAANKRNEEREQFLALLEEQKNLSEQDKQQYMEQAKDDIEQAKEDVLTNIGSKTVGNFAYAKKTAPIRTSPEIKDSWYNKNRLATTKAGGKIGLVEAVVSGDDRSDLKKWYRIKLPKPLVTTTLGFLTTTDVGYVREDVVTLKQV